MNLALAILFLWMGSALLFVAFHGLKDVETALGSPTDVLSELQSAAQKNANAYSTTEG